MGQKSEIFFSTGCLQGQTDERVQSLVRNGITSVELSGGPPVADPERFFQSLPDNLNVQLHNYFPPPLTPFVMNLCSPDQGIRDSSRQLARSAIQRTSDLGKKFYSLHAGFTADPVVADLGKTWSVRGTQLSMAEATAIFVREVTALANFAERLGVRLLVENNVLTAEMRDQFGLELLMMSTAGQIDETMQALDGACDLLLDAAHFQISCYATGVAVDEQFADLGTRPRAWHLSSNDGLADQNCALSGNEWFWRYIDSSAQFVTLEVRCTAEEARQQISLTESVLAQETRYDS